MRALRPRCAGGRCQQESGRHDDLELREFCEDCALEIRRQILLDALAEDVARATIAPTLTSPGGA
jgi:hypothetical protein